MQLVPSTRTPRTRRLLAASLSIGLGLLTAGPALAETVVVRITNLAPDQGLFLTPVFTTLHDGSVDLYDFGQPVSAGFERLAEDGSTQFLADEVNAASPGALLGATPGGLGAFPPPAVLGPGQTATITFDADPSQHQFLSYASMVIPSNDAFIGNDDPMAIRIFDMAGNFQSQSFTISGEDVLDAGTEVNNEMNAAFLNQAVADAGTPEGGVVTNHPGLNGSLALPNATPQNVLGGTNPMGIFFDPIAADFTRPGRDIARIEVVIPTPAALPAGLLALGLIAMRRRRGA